MTRDDVKAVLVEISFTGETICRFCLGIYQHKNPATLWRFMCLGCLLDWNENAKLYGSIQKWSEHRRKCRSKRQYRRNDDGPGTG